MARTIADLVPVVGHIERGRRAPPGGESGRDQRRPAEGGVVRHPNVILHQRSRLVGLRGDECLPVETDGYLLVTQESSAGYIDVLAGRTVGGSDLQVRPGGAEQVRELVGDRVEVGLAV